MALSLQDNLCNEIETIQLGHGTPSTATGHSGTVCSSQYPRRPRMHTFCASIETADAPADRKVQLPQRTQGKRIVKQISASLYLPRTGANFINDSEINSEDKFVMTGWLHKTSRPKNSKTRGHRQHRKFKLTAHSLEYSNLLQKVAIAIYT